MPHLFVSGLTLFEGVVDAEAYEAAKQAAREIKEAKVLWENAMAAATAALEDEEYAIVTGTPRTDLEAEVAKAEPTTKEDYQAATAALTTATTNFLAAAEAYNVNKADLQDEIAYAGSIGVATTDAETVLNAATSTGADFLAATEALKVLEYNTFAGEGTEYTVVSGTYDQNQKKNTG